MRLRLDVMKSRFQVRPIDVMVLVAVVAYAGWQVANRPPKVKLVSSSFAQKVDLSPFYRIAVQANGRLRSFESHAKTYMGYVSGPRQIDGQSNNFTYLDLMFRPQRYEHKDIIYVKNKQVRAGILNALKTHPRVDEDRAEVVLKSGLIARTLLNDPKVVSLLQRLGRDLIRTSKSVDAIQSAVTVANADFLADQLRLVAPPGSDAATPWWSISELIGRSGVPMDETHAGLPSMSETVGPQDELRQAVRKEWASLRTAWHDEDASAVNTHVSKLARLVPTISPNLYPSRGRLAMESWYFRNKSMTWVWWLYAAGVVPLLMAVIYNWDWSRKVGMVMFVIAFVGHTASLGIRWYISGRWPNTNMFEAVHTSAWFGGLAALVLEWLTRRTPFRNLFALGSAAVSMAALMAAYFLPAQLDSTINNKMAALNDVWLYIHTNVIILAYALIALASVTALLLLRHRWCVAWDLRAIPRLRLLLIPIALAVFNYTAYLLLMHVVDRAHRGLPIESLMGVVGACSGSLMLLLFELLGARARTAAGGLPMERSAAGGAAEIILGSSPRHPFIQQSGPTVSQVLDGATMVLLELSFITLWTGIIMGAIWADHSWGRPWGWDPKEVFALNTFIIFLILIHVRIKVRDKGFWSAVLAVVGFQVMMFNWIVVNFIITGLHSYA